MRESVRPKRNFHPNAWGLTTYDRRNPISPKIVKTKYPGFGLPRGTTTAGGMGIGLDDYIFNNSKRTESNTPRKTKPSDLNSFISRIDRPEEKKASF